MKEKVYNPASTNETAPAEGMGAVNTDNWEERDPAPGPAPKNLDREAGETDREEDAPNLPHRE